MTQKIVGGPNARTDYHINTTPEYFYQYKGSMLLKTVNPTTNDFVGKSLSPQIKTLVSLSNVHGVDIPINEGDMYLLPPNTPHNPVRYANTVGIVIEQIRPADSVDKLRWYCQNCRSLVHEKQFHCTDLGTQIKAAVEAFAGDESARKCQKCGEVCDVRPRE